MQMICRPTINDMIKECIATVVTVGWKIYILPNNNNNKNKNNNNNNNNDDNDARNFADC